MPVVRNFGRTQRGTPHPAPTPRNTPDSLFDDFNVGGTITNPIQVIDSDDESRIARVSDSEDDDEAMNEVINSVNAATIAHAAEHIIEGGQHGQPPAYTEPSYRDRVDQWLQAFSVMPPTQRQHWFDYIRRYFNDEVEQEVNQRTSALRARLQTATQDTITLRRVMSRIPDASRRFDFDSRSLWHRHRYNTGSFHVMPASQVRALAEQLLRAANGNESHPIIR
ncbi:hypothetical protein OC845_006537, partial [Tilletia horrida]